MFEVIDGGFHDIELRITDSEGKVIHEAEEKSGKYTFGSGEGDAKYTYCFINEKGSMAPKTIMFNMDVLEAGRAPGAPNEGEIGHNKLEDMVNEPICTNHLVHVCILSSILSIPRLNLTYLLLATTFRSANWELA